MIADPGRTRAGVALVVEDETRVLAALIGILERKAHVDAIGVTTLAQARDELRRVTPNACIVDLRLPDGSGLDLIREIRARHATARIVLATGYGTMEVGAAAIRAGANDVIAKPADAAEIVRRLYGDTGLFGTETPSADRAVWEHMHRVLSDCGGNKSLAARKLGVDRGTLQRWLDRAAPQP